MTNATGSVTWIECQCGHESVLAFGGGLAEEIIPRARCTACGARGQVTIRHGYKADAHALDRARLPGDKDERNW